MICLGLDPSLTDLGWAIHDDTHPTGSVNRCIAKGRLSTSSKMTYIDRYIHQREGVREIIRKHGIQRVGQESPIYNSLYSEGLYGLFLFISEALQAEKCDVVFWAPLQVKAHARELISRPAGWKMDKVDMVEASKIDAGSGKWNHNESDAYHVARLSSRFWALYDGVIEESDLTKTEASYFTEIKRYLRGRNAGREFRKGVLYREDERFFLWSQKDSE